MIERATMKTNRMWMPFHTQFKFDWFITQKTELKKILFTKMI